MASLVSQLIKAIENQLGENVPREWDTDVQNLRESIEAMETLNKDLEKDVAFLDCLNAAGVDNWSGYEQAQEMYDEEY